MNLKKTCLCSVVYNGFDANVIHQRAQVLALAKIVRALDYSPCGKTKLGGLRWLFVKSFQIFETRKALLGVIVFATVFRTFVRLIELLTILSKNYFSLTLF